MVQVFCLVQVTCLCEVLVDGVTCVCVWLGAMWVERGGLVDERIGFGLYQPCGDRGSVGHVLCFGCGGVGGGEWVGGLDQGRERWGGVMSA